MAYGLVLLCASICVSLGVTSSLIVETDPGGERENVNILVLLPAQSPSGYIFPFGMEMTGGAVIRAIDDIRKQQLLPSINLQVKFENSGCNAIKGIGAAYTLLHKRKYTGIIGPACSEVCKMVARLAVYLNIPCYSSVCQDIEMNDKNHFQTLSRLQATFEMTGQAVGGIMQSFNWNRAGIIASRQVDIIWLHTRRGIQYSFERMNITIAKSTLLDGEEGLEQTLIETAKVSRIIILAMLGSTFRKTMLLIHKHGLDNGEYIFLSTTYYSQVLKFGYYGWDYGDENDALVKEIYKSVFFISYYQPRDNAEFNNFKQDVKNYSASVWNYQFHENEDVPYPAPLLHEAIMVFAQVLNETLTEGGNISDGRMLARKAWGRSFPSLTGGVSLTATGDRDQTYMVTHLQNQATGEIEDIGTYFTANKSLQLKADQITWPNGQDSPPADTPVCGFDGALCLIDPNARLIQLVSIFSSVLGGTMILATIIIILVYRYMQKEREIMNMKWKIDPCEVTLRPGKASQAFSSRSNMSLTSIKTNASGMQVFAETGYFKGMHVAIKTATKIRNVNLTDRKLLRELNQIHGLTHANLVNFVGASIENKGVRLYTEYCMKGGLQCANTLLSHWLARHWWWVSEVKRDQSLDVLENPEIQLDWAFKCSIILDIIEGLTFIQETFLKFHGNLKSSSCLVDGRFVVKLNNFGMREWRITSERQARDKLWTAPEHLRGNWLGSTRGDIYSLGILVQEIICREGPFYNENYDVTDEVKVKRVQQGENPPFRPMTTNLDCKTEIVSLMKRCWAEDPQDRPNIREVKMAVKSASGMKQHLNIMDNLLQRMEQYANNLEELVEERTGKYLEEKKKAEDLLHRLLPQSIADELQERGTVDPVTFESVTIYFSDIVSFTPIASASTPLQVVDLLNDLYTLFDGIIEMYDVYKVETIGDAYMTVSGLPKTNGDDHVKEISLMALNLLHSVKTFKIRHLPDTKLLLRIGLHTGPCVAGVVGLTMPRYCLFGDTVNTASRMESNGEALKIHISPNTKDALFTYHPGFRATSRGDVFIKGKGKMETFWLLGGPPGMENGRVTNLKQPAGSTCVGADLRHGSMRSQSTSPNHTQSPVTTIDIP